MSFHHPPALRACVRPGCGKDLDGGRFCLPRSAPKAGEHCEGGSHPVEGVPRLVPQAETRFGMLWHERPDAQVGAKMPRGSLP